MRLYTHTDHCCSNLCQMLNTLRLRHGCHSPDDILKCIFLNENVWISLKISLNFVPKGPINNIPALVQIMAWRSAGDKPLSEPMAVCLLTHICVTWPQWVKECSGPYYMWKPKQNEHNFVIILFQMHVLEINILSRDENLTVPDSSINKSEFLYLTT